ncbi:ABC transporter permease [Prauserella marina]|uniref:Transport permease protein n=1 Tax=Prauserella marina TaxID=530584 RepID=A0A222VVZ9_9PSEU|nr:ABC transporter permease [Prauserella marina]ASR38084.1 ABC transporter permease [Prauserella marina]PWV78762.1 ABC-2 type transport system permease protein [Prauserella marina]SDC93053.1 ABC-2 type transport system permease protein [Prauserella marina]
MTTMSYAARDSFTMLRRNIRRMRRYPSMTLMLVGIPVVLLLLFVYVFGGSLGAGIGSLAGESGDYVNYLTPGIVLMAIASAGQGTAISVALDRSEGIIARFRTMAIARGAVLTGHVIGSLIQMMFCVVVIIGVALLVGFRPNATFIEWMAAFGMISLFGLALTWLTVALGLVSSSVETASNAPMPLILLPFLGSGFVPTDSMPTAIRWFAEYQPFTPVIETLRGLLLGSGIGNSALLAIAWCIGLTTLSYLWAVRRFAKAAIR